MTDFVTQAEFARQQGWAKSYITKLKGEGRLVMSADSKLVDVAASLARIADTDGQKRPDVAQRHAQERQGESTDTGDDEKSTDLRYNKADSSAKKEHFLALQAETDYRQRIGELVEASEVSAAISDVAIGFRQSLENLPARIAGELVGKDIDAIRAVLKAELYEALAEMERNFAAKERELGELA
jgi:hypothetical protein